MLEQRTKAEDDVAVAAASVLARNHFVDWMDKNSEELGIELPKGASSRVIDTGDQLVKARGKGILSQIAKTHFKTADNWL